MAAAGAALVAARFPSVLAADGGHSSSAGAYAGGAVLLSEDAINSDGESAGAAAASSAPVPANSAAADAADTERRMRILRVKRKRRDEAPDSLWLETIEQLPAAKRLERLRLSLADEETLFSPAGALQCQPGSSKLTLCHTR